MQTTQQVTIIGIVVLVVLIAGIVAATQWASPSRPGKLDAFATCLKDEGATFYGAFWCTHCQAQKKLFGTSAKLLPYVECSTPDGNSQKAVCIEKKIESYPTWEFADGSRQTGEVSLEALASTTSCILPIEAKP